MADLIGPLTAEEWCAFRIRGDDDLLMCCGVTSDFRSELFFLLQMGGHRRYAGDGFTEVWEAMADHGFPQGEEVEPLLAKLKAYYIDEEEGSDEGPDEVAPADRRR